MTDEHPTARSVRDCNRCVAWILTAPCICLRECDSELCMAMDTKPAPAEANAREAAEQEFADLALAARLLPSGGEPEWGWRGWSDQDPQRGMPLRDEAAAREVVAAHPGTELVRRQVGPWEVVSDSSEETAQWMIRDADGNTGDYADDEREIRRSWAQGITWWDPDGTYELCRRDGSSGSWEVVERHPVVSDNSSEEESDHEHR